MKRIFALTLAILFTIFTLPVNGFTILAEKEIKTYKDGTYTVPLNFLHEKNNEDSKMQNFSKDGSASVIIKNGKASVRTTFTRAKMIGSLKVDNKNADVFSENKVADERTYSFNVENLDAIINGEISVDVPGMYSQTHKIRLKFDVTQIPLVEDESDSSTQDDSSTEDPAEGNNSETEDSAEGNNSETEDSAEGNNSETEDLAEENNSETEDSAEENNSETKNPTKVDTTETDGTYDIIAKAMHETENKPSGAAGFINEEAQLIIKDGKFMLKIGVPKNDLANIDGIQVEDNKGQRNIENGVTYYTFNLEKLKQELPSQVQYSVPSMSMEHDVPFRFVLEGLDKLPTEVQKDIEKGNKTSLKNTTDNSFKNNDKNKLKKNNTGSNNEKTKKNDLTPDKAFSINYTIKHEDGVKTSVADEFFKKPGKLLEKDGVLYAQFTITNGNMIKQLSTEFGDVLIVKKNKDGSIVVQFKVNKDLSNMKLSMLIDVPGLYTETHEAILVFDKNSKKEIDASKEKLVASNSVNGPTVKNQIEGKSLGNGESNNVDVIPPKKDIDKPEFGSNDNKDLTKVEKSKNPQTGDLTNIWLYAFLLAGSLLILGFKYRRRTI